MSFNQGKTDYRETHGGRSNQQARHTIPRDHMHHYGVNENNYARAMNENPSNYRLVILNTIYLLNTVFIILCFNSFVSPTYFIQ